jgi:hypothetical protein
LFYSFQGVTRDGRYYVAAVLPVNYPGLPENAMAQLTPTDLFWSDFPSYMAGVQKTFDEARSGAFSPDLTSLDAMMASLEVR